jgi:hypothetical protein
VVHAYNPTLWGLRQKDYNFNASLGYTERLCFKKRKEKRERDNSERINEI